MSAINGVNVNSHHIPQHINVSPDMNNEYDDKLVASNETDTSDKQKTLTDGRLKDLLGKTQQLATKLRTAQARKQHATKKHHSAYDATFHSDFQSNNNYDDVFSGLISGNGSFLSYALTVLDTFRDLLSQQGDGEFTKMQKAQQSCRDAQEQANAVDTIIAEMSKEGKDAKRQVPQDIYQFMKDNGITIDGVPIDTYTQDDSKQLDKGQMTAVKQALSNAADRSTDLVSQDNIVIQKITQTYNTLMGISNSIQTMLADMNNKISQNIH